MSFKSRFRPKMLSSIIENIKTVTACVSAIGAACGGYIYLDGPIPATKQYVIAETLTIKKDLIDNRLQLNTVQRNLLRKEKFDRDLDLQKVQEPAIRQILQQRTDQISDELEAIEKERDELQKEKRK